VNSASSGCILELFLQEIDATESCETLQQSGHTAPGYYYVDGPGRVNYQLVRCNLDLDPSDTQFQVTTTTSNLPEYPVAFQCLMNELSTVNTTFPCTNVVVNVGNAIDESGIFTVPIDGVYMFTFTAASSSNDVDTHIRIRADRGELAFVHFLDDWDADGHGNELLTGSVQVVASLTKGQEVDAYLAGGYTQSTSYFTGHLLFPA
jgi:hypothetical protein